MAEVPWETLPGIIIGAIFLILIFGYGEYLGHKKHMRKMDLIEKGLWKPEYEVWRLGEVALLVGLIVTAVGAAFLSGSFLLVGEGLEWHRLGITFAGLIIFSVGIAFIIYHTITKQKRT